MVQESGGSEKRRSQEFKRRTSAFLVSRRSQKRGDPLKGKILLRKEGWPIREGKHFRICVWKKKNPLKKAPPRKKCPRFFQIRGGKSPSEGRKGKSR